MARDEATTDRLTKLISKLMSLTKTGGLHWERQLGSAHRYARWNNNLLILGPALPLGDKAPRYLFITPFDSPACVEVNSQDEQLGEQVLALVTAVEAASKDEPATDPFGLSEEVLSRFTD